ncbi:MAG TPA: cytochrome c biogenesis protein CcdA [Anaeromyxobacteraceae bacterium]|nr:cytochrome c biogenesis protein CcdA [Anaeromyxobacteraceae bacterium]
MSTSFDLPGLFGAGLLTFLSPCVLPLAPVYLGLLAGASVDEVRGGGRPGRLLASAGAFAIGLGAVFVALGLAATAAGRALAEHREILLRVGGVAVILFGLKLLGVVRVPLLDRESRPLLQRLRLGGSLPSAFLFGAAVGLGWTPCIGPVLGAVLTFTASAAASPARGALYLGTYAAGLGTPLLGLAAVAPRVLPLLDRARRHLRKMEVATGLLLLATGALLFADRLSLLVPASAPPAAASAEACPTGPAACTLPAPARAPGVPEPAPDLGRILAGADPAPRVVEIVSRACPVCRRMEPVVAEARRRCAGKSLAVDRRYVEEPSGAELARRHAVIGVPTFLLLDREGREVSRLVGEQPLAVLEGAMRDLSGGRCGT